MATWSFLMFATATAHIGMGFHSTDYTFIDSSDPVASVYNGHLGLGFTIAFVINNFLADTLLVCMPSHTTSQLGLPVMLQIYRLFIIWGSKLLVVVIPSVVCLGAFGQWARRRNLAVSSNARSLPVMSILEVRATVAASTTSEGDPNTINFGISYWSLTFSTNIIVSLLIAGRLLVYRHNLRKSFKDMASVGHDRAYLSIAAMIVESAALYTAVGLTFLGLFARHNAAQGFLVSILGQVEVSAAGYTSCTNADLCIPFDRFLHQT